MMKSSYLKSWSLVRLAVALSMLLVLGCMESMGQSTMAPKSGTPENLAQNKEEVLANIQNSLGTIAVDERGTLTFIGPDFRIIPVEELPRQPDPDLLRPQEKPREVIVNAGFRLFAIRGSHLVEVRGGGTDSAFCYVVDTRAKAFRGACPKEQYPDNQQ